MQEAYAAIGRAVILAQTFEVAFVVLAEALKMTADADYLKKNAGCIPDGAFRNATKNIVKELAKRAAIEPDLENRLIAFIEVRHTLVHRWVLSKGWPHDGSDDSEFGAIIALANHVEHEARSLLAMVSAFVLTHFGPPIDLALVPNEAASIQPAPLDKPFFRPQE